MGKQLKIDLHTHPFEQLKKEMSIKGIGDINKGVVQKIVKAIKHAGLDGIAITEYNNFNFGLVASYEIMDNFKNDNLFIFPGVEYKNSDKHFIQIFVPEYLRKQIPLFKGKDWIKILIPHAGKATINLENAALEGFDLIERRSLLGDVELNEGYLQTIKLPMIEASNAHKLQDIGKMYTNVEYNKGKG
jgi:hypothetical protein